jgi:hypothetical protein
MRRVLALVAAVALVVSVAGSSLATGSVAGTSRFAGSFDTYVDGQRVGHINAVLWPTTASQPVGGSYSTSGPLGSSLAIPTEVGFHHFATYNEVWFNGLEVGTGYTKAAFTGHFVDNFDPSKPDTVDFWVQPMNPVTALGGFAFTNTSSSPNHYSLTVGKGTFVLVVR